MKAVRYILFIVLVLLVTGCGDGQRPGKKNVGFPMYQEWKKLHPKKAGLDASILRELEKKIKSEYPHITSFTIVRRGGLVFEYYSENSDKNSVFPVQSVTKSVVSSLMGIAVQKGYIKDIDSYAADYFPEYRESISDERTLKVTLRHLLTMRASFAIASAMSNSLPAKMKLVQGMSGEPGTAFAYDNSAAHLLSVVLSKTTKMPAMKFAEKNLFGPLHFKDVKWLEDSEGNSNGGYGLYLRARDMAKLGYLYLNKGVWNGHRILSEDYVEKSWEQSSAGGFPEEDAYGYLWWLGEISGHRVCYAAGYGGQFIFVFPELDMVVTMTSLRDRHHFENKELLSSYVLPSVIE